MMFGDVLFISRHKFLLSPLYSQIIFIFCIILNFVSLSTLCPLDRKWRSISISSLHYIHFIIWPNKKGLWNRPAASLQRGKTYPTNVLHMILNNLEYILHFLRCELCDFGCWRICYCRIASWNISFGWVAWGASMMLEDPKLVRTPRTSLTRRFCALFLSVWLQLQDHCFRNIF